MKYLLILLTFVYFNGQSQSTIYVSSKSDKRYIAYQDSLTCYYYGELQLKIAKLLKEKGFSVSCLYYWYPTGITGKTIYKLLPKDYPTDLDGTSIETGYKEGYFNLTILAPLYQQVIDFLREKHNIHVTISPYYNPKKIDKLFYEVGISTKGNNYEGLWENSIERMSIEWLENPKKYHLYEDYYEALNAAIEHSLTLI